MSVKLEGTASDSWGGATPLLKYAERQTLDSDSWRVVEHSHEHHEMLVLLQGVQRSVVEGRQYLAGPGEVLFYRARTRHEESIASPEDVVKFTLGFAWGGDLRSVPPHLSDRSGRLTELASWIATEAPNPGDIVPPVVEPLLQGLIGELLRTSERAGQELRDHAQRLIRAQMSELRSVGDLARQLDMSRSHFCRKFRAETGETPSDFLREERVRRAAHLLRTTSMGAKEVAARVGVSSEQQLCRLLRQSLGMTSRQLRGR